MGKGEKMMKKVISFLLALSMSASLMGCSKQEEQTGEEQPSSAGVAVQVTTVGADTISAENTVSGKIVAENETAVYVMATATCLEVYVEEGQEVRAGDILCKLDVNSMTEKPATMIRRRFWIDRFPFMKRPIGIRWHSITLEQPPVWR